MKDEQNSPRAAEPANFAPQLAPSTTASAVEAHASKSPSPPSLGKAQKISVNRILVRPSANRDASAFQGELFELLVDSIRSDKGNTIPIIILKLKKPEGHFDYELISGERRLRACEKIGCDVNALIEYECAEERAFCIRLVENALRLNLTPYELGRQINQVRADGTRISLGHAATITGHDKSDLSKVRRLAELPDQLLAAFRLRTELQYKDGPLLSDALGRNQDAVMAEADRIARLEEQPPTREIVKLLVAAGRGGVGPSHPRSDSEPIEVEGRQVAMVKPGKKGTLALELSVPLDRRQRDALVKNVQGFFRRRVLNSTPTTPADKATAK